MHQVLRSLLTRISNDLRKEFRKARKKAYDSRAFYLLVCGFSGLLINGNDLTVNTHYKVQKLTEKLRIDANWDKPQWQSVEAMSIRCLLGDKPKFIPNTQAKLLYDDNNLYVIFCVCDHYVKAVAQETQGPVWEDSCVEFFFSPQNASPLPYFNLEINCGGTALMHYNRVPRQDVSPLETTEVERIEIASALPKIVNPEIDTATTWTIEYRMPLAILTKFPSYTHPRPAVTWHANFFKCGDKTSNPHWLTWSPITNDTLDFHQPQFFGTLVFE